MTPAPYLADSSLLYRRETGVPVEQWQVRLLGAHTLDQLMDVLHAYVAGLPPSALEIAPASLHALEAPQHVASCALDIFTARLSHPDSPTLEGMWVFFSSVAARWADTV